MASVTKVFRLVGQATGCCAALILMLLVSPLAAPLLSQESPPHLKFMWHKEYDFSAMVSHSSTIVVGVVRSVMPVGATVFAADDQGNEGEWQLTKVSINVEGSLKGDFSGEMLDFYVYFWPGGTVGDWGSFHVGERFVFLLTREAAVFRAVRDFTRSSIEVGTGRHRTLPLADQNSPEERISVLLLTPGEGLRATTFGRCIFQAVALADQWIGSCRTQHLLQNLLQEPNESVKDSARRQLSYYPRRGETCLDLK